MSIDVETKPVSVKDTSDAEVRLIGTGQRGSGGEKRAWTIKGIGQDTVAQSRKAARTQGMLLSLWVDKQLRDAAERELSGSDAKSFAAEVVSTKIEGIETALKEYLRQQDERIAELQKEVRSLSTAIIPPLLKVLSETEERRKKRA